MNCFAMDVVDNQYFPFLQTDEQLCNLTRVVRKEMSHYVKQYRLRALVLGVSGGIDSALCAALLRPVCEEHAIPLIGRSITIESNPQDEIERSIAVGEAFCHDFQRMDLTGTYFHNRENMMSLDDSLLTKMRQGNMKARMRMMVLYDLAQLYKGIVISTDNYTEYLTGFWTLHGDVGDYAPVMNLWKTEVYHLSSFLLRECGAKQKLALQACIDATPIDGLGISKNDCEQLGVADYFEADRIFYSYFFEKDKSVEEHPLIKRFHASAYKRKTPLAICRETLVSK